MREDSKKAIVLGELVRALLLRKFRLTIMIELQGSTQVRGQLVGQRETLLNPEVKLVRKND